MRIRSEPISICIRQTGLGVDVTNPVSHLVYTFECESMHITFAVDRPSVQSTELHYTHSVYSNAYCNTYMGVTMQ